MTNKPPVSPPLPLKTRLYIAVMTAATDACRRSDGSINRRLFNFLDTKASANPKPIAGVRTVDVTVDPSRPLRLRLFVPTAAEGSSTKLPVIVFSHGGGFAYLSAFSSPYDAVCRRIAASIPAVIASVDYRLTPEHRYPAQYDDVIDTLRFIADGGLTEYTHIIDISSCFLVGDSAGGNISHNVAARWAAVDKSDSINNVRVKGVVAIQAWFGGEERTDAEVRLAGAPLVSVERTDWLWRAFLPEGEDRDHEATNVFGPRGARVLPEGFPAVAVVVGGYDPLQDWQRRYYNGLRERGVEATLVEFKEAIHAFYVFPELSESGELIEELKRFVVKHQSVQSPCWSRGCLSSAKHRHRWLEVTSGSRFGLGLFLMLLSVRSDFVING